MYFLTSGLMTTVRRTFTDMAAEQGKTSDCYVRLDEADGNLVWASPLWITYEP